MDVKENMPSGCPTEASPVSQIQAPNAAKPGSIPGQGIDFAAHN